MSTSVRLDEETETLLNKTADMLSTTKTDVIKVSIRTYCENTIRERQQRPYNLISDLIGDEKSGHGNLAIESEKILREKFRKK